MAPRRAEALLSCSLAVTKADLDPKEKAARVLKAAGLGAALEHTSAWYSPGTLYSAIYGSVGAPLEASERSGLTRKYFTLPFGESAQARASAFGVRTTVPAPCEPHD